SRPEATVLHEDLVPPEILLAMNLEPWMPELLGIVLPLVDPPFMEPYIDLAEESGFPPDLCSLPKATSGLLLSGQMPPAVALVTSNMPCDGGMAQYALFEQALRIPTFRLDVPHNFYDDPAVAYFAAQLKELILWLEERTPGRMDWDRLREVCAERNRAVEHELELWDLLRARPAPLAAEAVYLTHLMFGIGRPGTPRGTEIFRRMAELAAANLREGKGALEDERFRAALWNPPTLIFSDLFAWAEPRWGVALLMDMLTYHRHPFVDLRSPDTMLRDLARILMQGPMARHTRGPAANFFGDLFHFTEELSLDMIWMAGHIGCKNTQALLGMFRELCRKRKLPLLIIDYDLSDTRIVTPAGIREQVDRFMETVMRAERLDRGDQGAEPHG
ncbi:MAG: 2-hydroxyacyl-CoA dehydratase family protein, partial [Polyangia bacterium]|nr:2-hydroxyacyl-CoA dehydratase family protein [Polyangia bacterium]